jgi:hypothetical protein
MEQGFYSSWIKILTESSCIKARPTDNAGDHLLASYCNNLKNFYNNSHTTTKILNYYTRKEIAHRSKRNQVVLNEQSTSSVVVLMTEASINIEDKANRRIAVSNNPLW